MICVKLKLIEYGISNQINTHFPYLFDKLSAIPKGIRCKQVLVNIVEKWIYALDMIVHTILMGLNKAFDCIHHKLLNTMVLKVT